MADSPEASESLPTSVKLSETQRRALALFGAPGGHRYGPGQPITKSTAEALKNKGLVTFRAMTYGTGGRVFSKGSLTVEGKRVLQALRDSKDPTVVVPEVLTPEVVQRVVRSSSGSRPAGEIPVAAEFAPENWAEYLATLDKSLWRWNQDKLSSNPITRSGYYIDERRLTAEEWATCLQLFAKHRGELLFAMENSGFGFQCALVVLLPPTELLWPGTPPDPPRRLLCITSAALPPITRPRGTQHAGNDHAFFDDGWRAFSPFTHDPENVRRLQAHGIEAPRDKSYYEY